MNLSNESNMTMSRKIARILSMAALSVVMTAGMAAAQDAVPVDQAPVDTGAVDNSGGGQQFQQQPQINYQQNQGGQGQGGGRRGRQQQVDAQGNLIQGQGGQQGQGQGGPGGGGGRRGRGGQQQVDAQGNPIQGGPGGGPGGGRGGRQQQYFQGQQQYVAPDGADQFTQEFGMIGLHNIFMQQRGTPPRVVRPVLPSTPEQLTVLTGLIKDDETGQYQAIVEDAGQNRVLHLKVNDTVLTGKITAIHISTEANDIVYQAEGKDAVTIPLGANFLGQSGGARNARLGGAMAISDFTGYNAGTNNLTTTSNFGRGGNFNNGPGGNFAGGGGAAGFGNPNGGRGGRGGGPGGFTQTPAVVVPAAPLPGDAAMSLEERMRLRRATETMAGAVAPITQAPAAAPAPTTPDATPAPAPIIDPNVAAGAGLTVEEQMRLRRLQQVGQ